MKKLLLFALAGAVALPAVQAQTGRIARLSHGGAVAARGEAEDDFGLVEIFVAEQIERLTDSTAAMHGYYTQGGNDFVKRKTTRYVQFQTRITPLEPYGGGYWWNPRTGVVIQPLSQLKKDYPRAVFIKFDKGPRPAPGKPSGYTPLRPTSPLLPGYWRGLAAVAALGVVGWRLGRQSKAV